MARTDELRLLANVGRLYDLKRSVIAASSAWDARGRLVG